MTTAPGDGSALPYRVIATDLDGTLLRGDETVSARTREALAAAVAAGASHIVVTGRPASRVQHILDAIGYAGVAVCGQGAQVYHAGERRLLTSVTLDRQVALAALAKIEAEVGPLAVASAHDGLDGSLMLGPGFRFETVLPTLKVGSREEMWQTPLTKLYIQHPALGDDELAEIATAAAGGLVEVMASGEGLVELLPLGLTKATGLSVAVRRLGRTAQDTIAFGDMPNDLPMLRWSGHSVAMANAHRLVVAAADEITASNEEDGVALVLERLLAERPGSGRS